MYSLFLKEIRSFLNSLIGYVSICVFLVSIGLFLWVFPNNEFNILESGFSNIDSLFIIAPWVFMILIPAITMRSFAEERRSGTIELLVTRPLTELQIILAKYFAGVVLVLISLIPTLLYIVSVYQLSSPVGNLDFGAIWGSYLGLFFLAGGFVAIGVFASSITDSQIVAFIIAMFFCFFCYIGFQSISSLSLLGPVDNIIQLLGINAHYVSMSRGVIDTRDVVYFLSLISVFVLMTRISLESSKW